MADGIAYRSYAKINIYLDVLPRRRDGFHNIETIFQTVNLSDQLSFSKRRSGISMECSTSELDDGSSNLAYRAARLLQERTGTSQGVYIYLQKRIPIAAGLAGGSGNAAATLAALNYLWDLGLPPARLREYALELGSDVPYCLVGGTKGATRRGEELFTAPQVKPTWIILLHPPLAVSTSRIYNSPALLRNTARPFAGKTPSFRRALRALERSDWAGAVFNRMEGAVFKDYPHLSHARLRLLEEGCTAAAMSGSGPTLFGVCASRDHAYQVAERLSEYRSTVAYTVSQGIEQE